MELGKELFDRIFDLGQKFKPDFVQAPGEQPFIYYRRGADGSLDLENTEPTPRNHTAYSLTTIIEHAKSAIDHDIDGKLHPLSPELWFSASGVILFIHKTDRRDRVTFPLSLSPQLIALKGLQERQPSLTQAQIIRELRITFRGCLGQSGNIVEILRRVKFNATQASDTTIEHGKSSIGKTLTAQVTGTDILPPEINITVPVFDSPTLTHIRVTVPVCLEPDAATSTFALIPPPGSIQAAIGEGEARLFVEIGNLIDESKLDDSLPVYFGKP